MQYRVQWSQTRWALILDNQTSFINVQSLAQLL